MSKLLTPIAEEIIPIVPMASIMQKRKSPIGKKAAFDRKKVVDGTVGKSHLVQGNVRNGIVLLVGRVIWSLILLKNRALGEKVGRKFGGMGKKV